MIAHINTVPLKKSQFHRLNDQIAAKEKELTKITRYKQSLYQDWKDGEITQQEYRDMKADYERQAAELADVLARLNAERADLANGVDQQHPALITFVKYLGIEKLTREILIELVDHIKVYENGNISVHFKFADEFRRIAEYIEINTTDTVEAGRPRQSMKSFWQCVFLIKRNLTDEGVGFILCEIKVFRIGNSEPALKFEIIEQPNNWVREMKKASGSIERTILPKIKDMLAWGVVKAGDILIAKGTDEESTLLANGHVSINDEEMSMQDWLERTTGWKSVETYKFAIHKETGKSLSQIRKKYMEENNE